VLTDNNNRASADVKACVGKRQAKMAESGSVLFMYDKKGVITVPSSSTIDEEKLLDAAIEQGVENDFSVESGEDENTWDVYMDPKETGVMMEAIKSLGYEADKLKMALRHISKAPVEVSDGDFEKNMAIIDALEELDDVDSVEHNMSN
jgi:transcriptional/translational regulatory protein YebC/TACO1